MPSIRVTSIGYCLLLIAMLASQQAFAGQPVDPSTLNPPPPPRFNPVCEKDGNQIICTLQFTDPPFAGGSGVICGNGANSYEALQFENSSVVGKRYYDQNGNLIRRHFREILSGTFTNPLNHVSVWFDGNDTQLHDLIIPGDPNTGTIQVTGHFRVFAPNGATVIFEAGRTIETLDDFISESGPHPFQDYFVFGDTAALQPLCDALQ